MDEKLYWTFLEIRVSLSADDTKLAFGVARGVTNGTDLGRVEVYDYGRDGNGMRW